MRQFSELPPLGLYIHIPWCIKKCPYCDFNSHAIKDEAIPESAYVDALLKDLAQELPVVWGRSITSVFIGGGTPSVFSSEALDRLFSGIRALTNLHPETEITMEANPGTAEQGRFNEYRAIGINRLSIGIQSFHNPSLQALGRIHNSDESFRAVEIARNAGFERLNLDIMFGLPEQNHQHALADVNTALSLQPDHISWYQLTLEPNTLFHAKPPILPDEDILWDIQQDGLKQLAEAGFEQYEVSAFAKPRQQCHHNMNYWTFGDYLGIGAGAHGKISIPSSGEIVRKQKQRHPKSYLQAIDNGSALSQDNKIPIADTGLEFMMNALRLREGVASTLYQLRTGVALGSLKSQLRKGIEQGFLEESDHRIATTELGFRYLNSVLELFMEPTTNPVFIPILKLDG